MHHPAVSLFHQVILNIINTFFKNKTKSSSLTVATVGITGWKNPSKYWWDSFLSIFVVDVFVIRWNSFSTWYFVSTYSVRYFANSPLFVILLILRGRKTNQISGNHNSCCGFFTWKQSLTQLIKSNAYLL